MRRLVFPSLFAAFFGFILSACGGGGGGGGSQSNDTGDEVEVFTGVFIDAPVEGLAYRTASQQGMTNAKGEFSYQLGEEVIFSIGALSLPAVVGMPDISPYDIFATGELYDPSVINLARLLQSLDVDGDPSNGIEISASAHDAITVSSVDFSSENFDADINSMMSNAGSINTQLIPSELATNHLFDSLDINAQQTCGSDHPLVGTSVEFNTYAHGVRGKLTITDNCTLTVSDFYYDGGGPAVAFYSGTNGNYASGSIISNNINGHVYGGETLTLTLPRGVTLDSFNGVAVWCFEFNANFGEAVF